MGHHRKGLVDRLDHILEQLDRGLGYLSQHKPGIDEGHIKMAKEQYEGLRTVLLEVEGEATNSLARMSHRLIFFGLLTPAVTCRIPFDFYVYPATPVSMISRCNHLPRLLTNSHRHC